MADCDEIDTLLSRIADQELRELVTNHLRGVALARIDEPLTFEQLLRQSGKECLAKDGAYSRFSIHEFRESDSTVPTLVAMIPRYVELGGQRITEYDTLYAEAVTKARHNFDEHHQKHVEKLSAAIMSTISIESATRPIIAAAAAAAVAVSAYHDLTATISVRVQNNNAEFYPVFAAKLSTAERTRALVDATVAKTVAMLTSAVSSRWFRLSSFAKCCDFAPAVEPDTMTKFVFERGDNTYLRFIPHTADGRDTFVRLVAGVMPALASALTDRVVDDVLARHRHIRLGETRYLRGSFVAFVFAETDFNVESFDDDIATAGVVV